MNSKEKLDLLMTATDNTLPQSYGFSSVDELKRARGLIESGKMSGCCVGIDVQSLLGECVCRGSKLHFFSDKLLHLLYSWVIDSKQREHNDYLFCKSLVDSQAFPKLVPGECFVCMGGVHPGDVQCAMVADDAPTEYRLSIKEKTASGVLKDYSAFMYANVRKTRILGLFVKLFDEYHTEVRRMESQNPWSRLYGCEHCLQGCEVDTEANMCQTCEVTWWCYNLTRKVNGI